MEKFIMPNHLPLISTLSVLSLLLVLPNSGSANDKRTSQALQLAQTEKVAKTGKYRKRKGRRQGRYFMRLYDANNDGKVTTGEIANDQARMLNAIDLNNDKSLSIDEMRRRGRSLQIWRSVTLFDLLDTNGNQKISAEELENIRRVFALYVTFPKSRWAEIRKAETDLSLFNKLMKEYKEKEMLNRKNRQSVPNSIHGNIESSEVFINDQESVVV